MTTSNVARSPTDDDPSTRCASQWCGDTTTTSPSDYYLPGNRPRTPPPQRDTTCAKCTNPETTPYAFNPKDKRYVRGEILQIQESVHTPIDALFARLRNEEHRPPARPLNPDKNPRPALVLSQRRIKLKKDRTMVCLMATYFGIHTFVHLPKVLQHFCLPVSPHCEIGAGVDHVQTTPEWQRPHGWLIAHQFLSAGVVSGRWEWEDQARVRRLERSFIVEEQELQRLRQVQGKRWDEWEARCAEEGFSACSDLKEFKHQG